MYRNILRLKNNDEWIRHLQNIKAKYQVITEEVIEEIFSFPLELEWISVSHD